MRLKDLGGFLVGLVGIDLARPLQELVNVPLGRSTRPLRLEQLPPLLLQRLYEKVLEFR